MLLSWFMPSVYGFTGRYISLGSRHLRLVSLLPFQFLVACVSWLFPDFHFQWLADETRRNLPHELDFTHEAGNQEKCATMFRHLKFMKVWEGNTCCGVP